MTVTAPTPRRPEVATSDIGSMDIEDVFLGCLMHLSVEDAAGVLIHVSSEHFTGPTQRLLHDAAVRLVDAGIEPTPFALLGNLRQHGEAQSWSRDASCGVRITDMYALAPAGLQARYFARLLHDHLLRRRVQAAGVRLAEAAGRMPLDALLDLMSTEATAVAELGTAPIAEYGS